MNNGTGGEKNKKKRKKKKGKGSGLLSVAVMTGWCERVT
jgi:hypothetical protein